MDNIRNKVEQMNEQLKKDIDLSKIEEMLKDNKIIFDYKDKKYRVRLLNLAEKEELLKFQVKKEMDMLNEGIFKYEKVLIPILKQNGTDIEAMDKRINDIYREECKIMLKLGEAEKEKETEDILSSYKEEIVKLRDEIKQISIEKSIRLNNSLENQLLNSVVQYMVFLGLEVLENDKYLKMYKTYDEFLNNINETLMKKAVAYITVLEYVHE